MGVLLEQEFWAAVEGEVRRAVRYSHVFSVIRVDLSAADLPETFIEPAAEVFGGMIRETDVVGRLKGPRLGAILHYAKHGAANTVARRIKAAFIGNAALAPGISGLEGITVEFLVLPSVDLHAGGITAQLEVPEHWKTGDDDDSPGPAGIGARI